MTPLEKYHDSIENLILYPAQPLLESTQVSERISEGYMSRVYGKKPSILDETPTFLSDDPH